MRNVCGAGQAFLLSLAVMGISNANLRAGVAAPDGARDDRVGELERRVKQLEGDLQAVDKDDESRFIFGGYGDFHANFGEGSAKELFDIHRLVFYVGYEFADWIKFNTEIEIEHAFVQDGNGELSLEQAYFDFLLSDPVNIRVGRVITPIGIVNSKHEPPTFNGVERPNVAKYIIPSTWSSDGIGVFGNLMPSLTYEAYVVAGLDGSKFDAKNGIRKGRIKERPSFHDPAFTARLDYFPFAERAAPYGQTLRLGVSAYVGGYDNANKGGPGTANGTIRLFSYDVEYTISKFDLRGVIAHIHISNAAAIGSGTAEQILGGYLEAAYHFWPKSWKKGKLSRADAAAFVRYDDYNTQFRLPAGVAANPAGNRNMWTIGVNFYPTPTFVLKADVQVPDDETGTDQDILFNLGVGFQF